MNDIATTVSAGPRVLLVTHGEYSYYGVDFVLLAPKGRDPEKDLKEYEAHIERLVGEVWNKLAEASAAAGFPVMARADAKAVQKELEILDNKRRRLPKDTPERAKLWHKCKAMKKRLDTDNHLDRELRNNANHQVWRQICEEHGFPVSTPSYGSYECDVVSPMRAYFVSVLGYSECVTCEGNS